MHSGPFTAVVAHQPVDRQVDFADQYAVALSLGVIAVGDGAHVRGNTEHLGLIG
jgi:hypothetical protein